MIPVLFESVETMGTTAVPTFTTQGLGALTDAVSCIVTEERNSVYELEMTYPIDGIHFEDIKVRRIIAAIPSPYRQRQPFRIYKISRPLDGLVTIYAAHISYDLNGIPVNPFSATGITAAMAAVKNNLVFSTPFTFTPALTNSTSAAALDVPTACRSVLGGVTGSLLDVFGGEYEFDGFNVKLWLHRGSDSGVTVRYAKNMTALTAETDIENTVTGILPYWYKDGVLVQGETQYAADKAFSKVSARDFTTDFDEQPTADELAAAAASYIKNNDIGDVPVSIDVSFVDMADASGYLDNTAALSKCDLCDTVTVQHEELGVNVSAKIVKIETDVLLEKYNSITVGTATADIAQTISETSQKVDQAIRSDGSIVAQKLKGFINGALTNLYAQADSAEDAGKLAILFECNDTSSDLYGAMALGTQGLLIAKKKKSDGTGWDWTTAITADGLMAGVIVAGILTDKEGNNYWNLDTGELVSKSGTIGGWEINEGNLKSPQGNMLIDSATGTVYTVRQNGNKGMTLYDDGLLLYSWALDGNYVGRIGTDYTEISSGTKIAGMYVTADTGDTLSLGVQELSDPDDETSERVLKPYIVLSNVDYSDATGNLAGVTVRKNIRLMGTVNLGTYGSDTAQIYVSGGKVVFTGLPVALPAGSTIGGKSIT